MTRAMLAVVVAGVAARLAQWLGNPSLWFDELQLVQNLTERGLFGLLIHGLDYGQVAPVGYLFLTKLSMLLFDSGELVLRLVPFLASVTALVLFQRLATRILNPTGAFVATAAFALNPLLISLAAVVKQYSTDVLAVVLILLAVERLWDTTSPLRSRTLLAVGVGTLGFLSIPAVNVAAAAMPAVLYRLWSAGELRARETRGAALIPLVVWGATAAAAALVARALLDPGTQEFMTGFWRSRDAFAPPFTEYPSWVFGYGRGTLLPGFFFRPYFGRASVLEGFLWPLLGMWTLLGLLVVASGALVRARGVAWSIAILVPMALTLGLSRFELYPLHPRTSAFLVPLVIVLAAAPADLLAHVVGTSRPLPRAVIAVLALVPMTVILWDQPPVYEVQATRAVMAELSDRRAPDEPVFAHPWSASALSYYGPRFGLDDGVTVAPDGDLHRIFSELESLRGEPSVWVLFTLAEDRELYLCYLDEVGTEVESVVLDVGRYNNPASIHRYDLSDETRWTSADPATFPLTDEAFEGDPPRCRRRG